MATYDWKINNIPLDEFGHLVADSVIQPPQSFNIPTIEIPGIHGALIAGPRVAGVPKVILTVLIPGQCDDPRVADGKYRELLLLVNAEQVTLTRDNDYHAQAVLTAIEPDASFYHPDWSKVTLTFDIPGVLFYRNFSELWIDGPANPNGETRLLLRNSNAFLTDFMVLGTADTGVQVNSMTLSRMVMMPAGPASRVPTPQFIQDFAWNGIVASGQGLRVEMANGTAWQGKNWTIKTVNRTNGLVRRPDAEVMTAVRHSGGYGIVVRMTSTGVSQVRFAGSEGVF